MVQELSNKFMLRSYARKALTNQIDIIEACENISIRLLDEGYANYKFAAINHIAQHYEHDEFTEALLKTELEEIIKYV